MQKMQPPSASAVPSASAAPPASIIILTYNNREYTRLCLESIYAHTEAPDFEVILVDNASTDDTPAFLQDFASQKSNVKLILNQENAGFSRGNNQGAAAAEGEYLVLLNNDTVVTPGWLSGLIRHLQDPSTGMVGPVTNAAGNESRIRVDYQGLTGMQAFARQYTREHANERREIRMLALFCTALRRSVYEEIGPLDERFGFGMFEDDDYSLRMKEKGYRLLCAEDVFVHHWGSAGFSSTAFERYWHTFQENRQKFEDKWGLEWIPPRFRDELRDEQLSGYVKDKTWLANLVIDRDRTINELLQRISMVESSSSYRITRLIWRVLARLAPANSPQHRLGRAAVNRLAREAKKLRRPIPEPQAPAVRPAAPPIDRALAEKQLDELLLEHAQARDVVVLAPTILWNVPLFQRPQQMALAFARQGCLTIYCEIPNSTDFPPGFNKISERLYVYARAPLEVLRRIPSPAVIVLAYNQHDLENFSQPRVVYEYIDELNVLPGDLATLQRNHDAQVRDANVVVATADVLFQRLQATRPDAILAPNAVDAEFIRGVIAETQSPPEDIAALVARGPIIGYYGALARWFNFNLWMEAARARPNYQFLLIGPDYDGSVQELQRRPGLDNIHWLGTRPYRDLPRYLKYFDVATIPFRLNEITHSTSPIKLFEYMVAEKPVVTTAMRECLKYACVLIGRNETDFIAKLDEALKLRDDDSYKRLLQQTAQENTWDRRAAQILNTLPARKIGAGA